MGKSVITREELEGFVQEHWILYCNKTTEGIITKFWYNGIGQYKITRTPAGKNLDDITVLQTFMIVDAIVKYNSF